MKKKLVALLLALMLTFPATLIATAETQSLDVTLSLSDGCTVTASWNAVSGAVSYDIYEEAVSPQYLRGTTTGTSYSFESQFVAQSAQYDGTTVTVPQEANANVYVVACLESGEQLWGLASEEFTFAIPETTSLFINENGYPELSWTPVLGAWQYEVARSESEQGRYVVVAAVSSRSYTDSGAEMGKDYFYRVRALLGNNGLWTPPLDISLAVAYPDEIKALLNNGGGIAVSWSEVARADGYQLYRKAGSTETLLYDGAAPSYIDKSANKDGQTYVYSIYAYTKNDGVKYVSDGFSQCQIKYSTVAGTFSFEEKCVPLDMIKGTDNRFRGKVSSEYALKSVTVRIKDSNGNIVTSATDSSIDENSFDIKTLDWELAWDDVPAGRATAEIFAKNALGEAKIFASSFIVGEPQDTSLMGELVLKWARTRIGDPYSQAQRGQKDYVDCSYFAQWCYRQATGMNLFLGSAASMAEYCVKNDLTVEKDELQPGDLLFYGGQSNGRYLGIWHVEIYISASQSIGAGSGRGGVQYSRPSASVLYARPYIALEKTDAGGKR